jgi:hypothetical protein
MMNSRFVIDRAKAMAGRVLTESGEADGGIERTYRRVLGRPPTAAEHARARAFLHSQAALLREPAAPGRPLARPDPLPTGLDPALAAAWVDFTLAMLNRNEFLYVP